MAQSEADQPVCGFLDILGPHERRLIYEFTLKTQDRGPKERIRPSPRMSPQRHHEEIVLPVTAKISLSGMLDTSLVRANRAICEEYTEQARGKLKLLLNLCQPGTRLTYDPSFLAGRVWVELVAPTIKELSREVRGQLVNMELHFGPRCLMNLLDLDHWSGMFLPSYSLCMLYYATDRWQGLIEGFNDVLRDLPAIRRIDTTVSMWPHTAESLHKLFGRWLVPTDFIEGWARCTTGMHLPETRYTVCTPICDPHYEWMEHDRNNRLTLLRRHETDHALQSFGTYQLFYNATPSIEPYSFHGLKLDIARVRSMTDKVELDFSAYMESCFDSTVDTPPMTWQIDSLDNDINAETDGPEPATGQYLSLIHI